MNIRIIAIGLSFLALFFPAALHAQTVATMSSPTPGSTLTGSSQTFNWTSGSGAFQYFLYVGSTQGSNNYFGGSTGTVRSQTVSGLPTNGSTVYVRLYTLLSNGWWYIDYSYSAASPSAPATMSSPTPGSTLTGSSQTFNWTSGSGAFQYFLYVGSTQGSNNYFGGSTGTVRSQTVSGLPTNGSTVYVRLYTLLSNGWWYIDYSYAAMSAATGLTPPKGAPAGWGTVLGANPVTVYSNGISGYWSGVRNPVTIPGHATYSGGIAYQCVELTQRACILIYKSDPGGANAVDWWKMTSYFNPYPNSGTTKPAVGDLVVWSGGSSGDGHIAIITAVNSSSVTLAEQNVLCTTRDAAHVATLTTFSDSKGLHYNIDNNAPNSHGGFTTLGWLRKR